MHLDDHPQAHSSWRDQTNLYTKLPESRSGRARIIPSTIARLRIGPSRNRIIYRTMAAVLGRVIVYGGKGALGSACVSQFKSQNWVSKRNSRMPLTSRPTRNPINRVAILSAGLIDTLHKTRFLLWYSIK